MIDTNVVVSALISPQGKAALIPLAIRSGLLHPCLSADVYGEYAEVLGRTKFGFDPAEVAAMLAMFQDHAEYATPELLTVQPVIVLPDPDDMPFLRCALALGAECIVTGNKRHFPRDRCAGIDILSPAEMLDRLSLEI